MALVLCELIVTQPLVPVVGKRNHLFTLEKQYRNMAGVP